MKICHNCGRELENTIKNCIRCNEEQPNDAVIFKATPKPPPDIYKKQPAQQDSNDTPTQSPTTSEPKDNPSLVTPFDGDEPIVQTPSQTEQQPAVFDDKSTFEPGVIDSIIADELSQNVDDTKRNSFSWLFLLVLLFIIVILFVQPYIKKSISPSIPVYQVDTSVTHIENNTPIPTITEESTQPTQPTQPTETTETTENDVIVEQFPEFEYLNTKITDLDNLDESTSTILGNDYRVTVTTNEEFIITNVDYEATFESDVETLEERISAITQICELFTSSDVKEIAISPEIETDSEFLPLSELTLDTLTQDGFEKATFISSFIVENNSVVTITVECTLVDGVYTLVNSIDFAQSNVDIDGDVDGTVDAENVDVTDVTDVVDEETLGESMTSEVYDTSIDTSNNQTPTESPYTQGPEIIPTMLEESSQAKLEKLENEMMFMDEKLFGV